MLKIILIILCIFVIFLVYNKNEIYNISKERFINPYSNESNELISDIEKDNNYRFNLNNKDCFSENNLLNIPLNIYIGFKDEKMNNFNNNKNKILFCNDDENAETAFGNLLNNSLPYNNILIHTGNSNNKNDEWEIIKLGNMSPLPLYNIPPPKINKCGFLIRNIVLDRFLGYGDIKENDGRYDKDDNFAKKDVVFTGASKYINYKYLWDLEKIGCNTYSIKHIYTGKYLNSTIPNLTYDFINQDNYEYINKYGELFCDKQKFKWFIAPIQPLNMNKCNKDNIKCSKNFNKKYKNLGVEGNCCHKKLKKELCLHGSNKQKNKKILNFPSVPWCGIKKVCN